MFMRVNMNTTAHDLGARVAQSASLEQVRKSDLQSGDRVLVTTRNSRYRIEVLGDGMYRVSGGWFDRKNMSPLKLGINGCTWGGSAIKVDVVAACGLHLEFGNRVLTSRIERLRVIPAEIRTTIN
jgi:hypothetical protein